MIELLIIVALQILNGLFSMSEMAVVSARRSRLQAMVEEDDKRAELVLKLQENPDEFLSTVQIGITLIGVLSGAFGGAALGDLLAAVLRDALSVPYEVIYPFSFAFIVVLTTYLSLIIGELVPKQIALNNPERVACAVAGPMGALSHAARFIVNILAASSTLVLRLIGVKEQQEPSVTESDVLSMIREGTSEGVFDSIEEEMVQAIFRLDDMRIGGLVTPRPDIVWLNVNDDEVTWRKDLAERVYYVYPVCDGDIDAVIGMVRSQDILSAIIRGETLDLRALMHEPLFIPQNVSAAEVLGRFREAGIYAAIIINEFGDVHGIITMRDIVEQLVGDMPERGAHEDDKSAVQRADGSWLLDGSLPILRLESILDEDLPEDEAGEYETLAGFVLARLQRIPQVTDTFDWLHFRFEVVDMDGKRVDKVLVQPIPTPSSPDKE